ncbi:hypothetical protein [Paenibacillus alvei]|uniref:hypothetical protein n=1 Tax=Paenibacillus alvei TaxID=44250 RepID=UPI003D30392A
MEYKLTIELSFDNSSHKNKGEIRREIYRRSIDFESNLITDTKYQMFALYCIVELVVGNDLNMEEVKKAASIIWLGQSESGRNPAIKGFLHSYGC